MTCVSVCMRVCIRLHICLHVNVCVRACVCVCGCEYSYTYIYMSMCACACYVDWCSQKWIGQLSTHPSICTCKYPYRYLYTHTHTHTHTDLTLAHIPISTYTRKSHQKKQLQQYKTSAPTPNQSRTHVMMTLRCPDNRVWSNRRPVAPPNRNSTTN